MTVVGASEIEVPPFALRADSPVIGPPDRWWVQMVFHQRAVTARRDDEAFDLVHAVMQERTGATMGTRPTGMVLFGPTNHRETVVELTMPLLEDDLPHLQVAIDRGLDALRDADRATIIASDAAQAPLAPADVWPIVPCVRRDAATGQLVDLPRIIVLENNELRDRPVPDELNAEAITRVESTLGAMQARQPFVRWREWLLAAEEARLTAHPEDAILRLSIAVEVMLDAVFALSLWERGDSPCEAAAVLRLDLGVRIKRHFSALLGGSWDRARPPVQPWSHDLAYLRGRVVHRGHRPSSAEVTAAFGAAQILHDSIVDRVVSRRSQIPKTAFLLVGPQELEQRGAWDGAVRRLGRDGGLADDDWLLSYDRWRGEADAIVAC
ncbi:MAG: hypothetical protein QOH12_1115 [Solirubrobacteraceae bacterium]|nr:hypothetical protein [Solirubrobacteraceae bacterium]